MEKKNLLDFEEAKPQLPPLQFRPLAIVLEAAPFLACMAGLLIQNNSVVVIAFTILAFVYFSTGWYLFKAEKFTVSRVIFAVISGIVICIGVLTILFQVLNWQGKTEMKISGGLILLIGLFMSVVWYVTNRKNEFELRFSLKIISRVAAILLALLFL